MPLLIHKPNTGFRARFNTDYWHYLFSDLRRGLIPLNPTADTISLNPFLLGAWTPMGLDEWRRMGILASAILIGSIGAAIAYQKGPASIIAIFDFSYVGFVAIWGFLLFAGVPANQVAPGIVMIITAGIISTRQHTAAL